MSALRNYQFQDPTVEESYHLLDSSFQISTTDSTFHTHWRVTRIRCLASFVYENMITCKEKYGFGIEKLGINKVNISSRLLEVIHAIVILQTNSNE